MRRAPWPEVPRRIRTIWRRMVERQIAASPVRFPFSAMNPGLQNPYAMHYQFNLQRELTSSLMLEAGYVGVRGVKFPLHRRPNLPGAIDRYPAQSEPGFRRVLCGQHAEQRIQRLQTSVRKRFSHNLLSTLTTPMARAWAHRSDIGAYYGSDNDQMNIQEFNNPRADRGPNQGDSGHRFISDWVYELPRLAQSIRW